MDIGEFYESLIRAGEKIDKVNSFKVERLPDSEIAKLEVEYMYKLVEKTPEEIQDEKEEYQGLRDINEDFVDDF